MMKPMSFLAEGARAIRFGCSGSLHANAPLQFLSLRFPPEMSYAFRSIKLSSKPFMRYELRHSASEGCHTFFLANQRPPDLTSDARFIWAVEAATWEEAQTAKHEFLGLEPYRPMEPESDSPNPTS
jgi:hypothetical protein